MVKVMGVLEICRSISAVLDVFSFLLQVVYWDAYDGSAIRELEGLLTGSINAMDISQSGSHFVTGTGPRPSSFHWFIYLLLIIAFLEWWVKYFFLPFFLFFFNHHRRRWQLGEGVGLYGGCGHSRGKASRWQHHQYQAVLQQQHAHQHQRGRRHHPLEVPSLPYLLIKTSFAPFHVLKPQCQYQFDIYIKYNQLQHH